VHTLGAVLGCFISIPTMALMGRRGAALYVMTLAYLLGYLLIGFAQNVEMIIIGELFSHHGLIGLRARGMSIRFVSVEKLRKNTLTFNDFCFIY
jgi:hypothetical protein